VSDLEVVLGDDEDVRRPLLLRPHRPGDLGWVVSRHGALYAQEYGWNSEFEGMVAKIAATFLEHYDARCEHCWIAERDGEPVGTVMLVKKTSAVAQLRLLLVEPRARGLGLGARLTEECERFARQAGYRSITLWTQANLHAARRLYESAGYRRVKETPHRSFGADLVAEDWEKHLA
jgi:GNAT superfamily N-acetyltransferase